MSDIPAIVKCKQYLGWHSKGIVTSFRKEVVLSSQVNLPVGHCNIETKICTSVTIIFCSQPV